VKEYFIKLKNIDKPILVVAGKFEVKFGDVVFWASRRAVRRDSPISDFDGIALTDSWFLVAAFSYDDIEGKIKIGKHVDLSALEQENDHITIERCATMMADAKTQKASTINTHRYSNWGNKP
jgi:hypothetical protein